MQERFVHLLITLTTLKIIFENILFILLVVIGLLAAIFCIEYLGSFRESYSIKSIPIVSLDRSKETNGSFILGFGGISTNIVYYAYSTRGVNMYELQTFDLYGNNGKLSILESDTEIPRYSEFHHCWTQSTLFLDGILSRKFQNCEINRRLYVPIGTIHKEFNG